MLVNRYLECSMVKKLESELQLGKYESVQTSKEEKERQTRQIKFTNEKIQKREKGKKEGRKERKKQREKRKERKKKAKKVVIVLEA